MSQKKNSNPNTIALNKKASHDYFIEQRFEAGLVLEGWEVKSLRAHHAQIRESYVTIYHGEAFLTGAHFTPLESSSTHVNADPTRSRKLLLNRRELGKLIGAKDRLGYSIVPTALYWKGKHAKLEIAIAKGKKLFDKRATLKEKTVKREQQYAMKQL